MIHSVRLPRRRNPPSYSAQFAAAWRIFGMWWRPLAFFLWDVQAGLVGQMGESDPTCRHRHPCTNADADADAEWDYTILPMRKKT